MPPALHGPFEPCPARSRPLVHAVLSNVLTVAADSTPCARCSSSTARPVARAVARHRGRAARDDRPRARRVGPSAPDDATQDSSSRGARHGHRPSASPAAAKPTSAGRGGRACGGSGWRSPGARSGRSAARSSWASRRRHRGPRSPDRRRRVNEPSIIRRLRAAARGGGARSVRSAARRSVGRWGPVAPALPGGFRRPRRDTARR